MPLSDNKSQKCPFCGAKISSDDTSCRKCGKRLRKETGNGARKGLAQALSKKYRDRIAAAEKKERELVTREAKKTALELFSLLPNIGMARAEVLWDAGFRNLEDLKKASVDELASNPQGS